MLCWESSKEKAKKGGERQAHLSGGKGESVRVSREGVIRDMTHHAGAVHWRANTLEPIQTNLGYLFYFTSVAHL